MNKLSGLRLALGAGASSEEMPFASTGRGGAGRADGRIEGGGISVGAVGEYQRGCLIQQECYTCLVDPERHGRSFREEVVEDSIEEAGRTRE